VNYSPLNSLSNGIFILWSFLTNLNILAAKVGKNKKNPILGTTRGRGLIKIISTPPWKNQSSDFNLVDFCTSGALALVDLLEGLDSRALKLELEISQFWNFLDVLTNSL
jgi:hypothetical protein